MKCWEAEDSYQQEFRCVFVKKEGISYGAGSYMSVPYINDVASWGYYAFLNPTKKDAVDKAVREEIAKALKDGFTEDELKANKKSWQNSRKTGLGNDGTLMGLVNSKLYMIFR